jgi:ribosomal RNA-processing protein 1
LLKSRSFLSTTCSPDDIRVPTSLAFHVSDVYLEELDKALATTPPSPAPLSLILSPFFTLAARTQTNTTYKHIQETIFDPLFDALRFSQPEESPNQKRLSLESSFSNLISNSCVSNPRDGAVGSAELRKALLRRIFNVASEESTRDSNRRKMYAVFKAAKEYEDDSGPDS